MSDKLLCTFGVKLLDEDMPSTFVGNSMNQNSSDLSTIPKVTFSVHMHPFGRCARDPPFHTINISAFKWN